VWRIKYTAAYEGTEETVFAPRCTTWNDFVKNVAEYAGVSRSTLYSRIRLYDQLQWLGYDLESMYSIVVKKSYLAGRVLDMILNWPKDVMDGVSFKTDYFGDSDPEDVKEEIQTLLEECLSHDSVAGAIENVKTDVLGKPVVNAFFGPGTFVLAYEGDGETDIVHYEIVEKTSPIPEWVWVEVENRYKLKRAAE
jgi:hypothetical protein